MESRTTDTQTVKAVGGNILSTLGVIRPSMSLFGNIIMLIFHKGVIYTILMARTIIDLNRLYVCLKAYIQRCTWKIDFIKTLCGRNEPQRKRMKRLGRGIAAKKDGDITAKWRRKTGRQRFMPVFVSVLSAIKRLWQGFQQQSIVRMSVDSSVKRYEDVKLGKELSKKGQQKHGNGVDEQGLTNVRTLVRRVERSLLRLNKRDFAPTLVGCEIGGVEIKTAKGSDYEYVTNVYDLEVEDAHEYFVNGTLVHNTGYNRGSAYVVRDKVIYCIKYYDFPDLMDAPKVVRHDFSMAKILWLPDVTIKDSFPSFAAELRKYDIKIIYKKKSPLVEDSCFLVSKLCYLSRFIVCKIAKDLAEALGGAMRDKDNRIPKGSGTSSPIHALDGARYASVFIVATHPDFEDVRRLILEKRASLRDSVVKEPMVKALSHGYREINPEIYKK
jgi:hypothetical protein